MAAKLKVDELESVDGSTNLILNNSVTMAANQTLPAASLTGNLPAISAANLTAIPAGNLTGTVADARISALTASKLTGALPAVSAANLTAIPAANITGTLPAISGVNLTALNATNLGSGTVPTARLGSGTASNSVFLRGDGSWQTAGSTSATDLTSGTLPTGRLPTGSILQVVRVDSGTQVTATNSAYVDVFSSDLSITAKETGSKFHILVNLAGLSWSSNTAAASFRAVGAGETLHLQTHFAYGFGGGSGAADNHRLAAAYNTVTSGTTTQGTTYAFNVEFKNSNSSYTIKVNEASGHSSLLVMEVAG